MKLGRHPRVDALCGEYLLGTLQGGARRRLERAIREEPLVALRVAHWQRTMAIRPSGNAQAQMTDGELRRGFKRLHRELGLRRFERPARGQLRLWRGWAIAATIALAVSVALQLPLRDLTLQPIAEMAGPEMATVVAAEASADGSVLRLTASRPVQAGPAQSYELWVIPAGGAPISLAVLGELTARIEVPQAQRARLTGGATLAVTVEPAGGSPTGAPTGPIVVAGKIRG